MPYKDEISEPVKLVVGFESLVHDGTVLGLKKGLNNLFLNVFIRIFRKFRVGYESKNIFWSNIFVIECYSNFIFVWIVDIF